MYRSAAVTLPERSDAIVPIYTHARAYISFSEQRLIRFRFVPNEYSYIGSNDGQRDTGIGSVSIRKFKWKIKSGK